MADDVRLLDLALWARQFSTLINAGVSLVRSMAALERAAGEPLTRITREMREAIEGGDTLSAAMARYPRAFTGPSVALCRAGEVGGVLDETFAVWADWLERDLELRGRVDMAYLLARAAEPSLTRVVFDARLRAHVGDNLAHAREMTWCRTAGMMLESGVPVLQTLEVATRDQYPDRGDEWVARIDGEVRGGRPLSPVLEELGFSPITVQLARVGEECGSLDRMLDHAATLLERELATRLTAALAAMLAPEPRSVLVGGARVG
jgi:type II secretory pathway component PulF